MSGSVTRDLAPGAVVGLARDERHRRRATRDSNAELCRELGVVEATEHWCGPWTFLGWATGGLARVRCEQVGRELTVHWHDLRRLVRKGGGWDRPVGPRGPTTHPMSTRSCVLRALSVGEACGLDIVERVRQSTGGLVELQQGSVYPSLRGLEADGVVNARPVKQPRGGRDKRVYVLTDLGREELARDAKILAGIAALGAT